MLATGYDKIFEEVFKDNKESLKAASKSGAEKILSNGLWRYLFSEFLSKEVENSNIQPDSMQAYNKFGLLSEIPTSFIEWSGDTREKLYKFYSEEEVGSVHDDSSLNKFLLEKKNRCYKCIDRSTEFKDFKKCLTQKYKASAPAKKRTCTLI